MKKPSIQISAHLLKSIVFWAAIGINKSRQGSYREAEMVVNRYIKRFRNFTHPAKFGSKIK